jgi:hypothetical protein
VVEYSHHYSKVKGLSPTTTTNGTVRGKIVKNCGFSGSSDSAVVEYSPHYPKVKGLSPATTTAGMVREKMVK